MCYKSDSERRFDSSIGELKRGLARTARTARTARIDWDTDSTKFDGTASCDNKNKVNMVTQIST